jgi:hypothetical protein
MDFFPSSGRITLRSVGSLVKIPQFVMAMKSRCRKSRAVAKCLTSGSRPSPSDECRCKSPQYNESAIGLSLDIRTLMADAPRRTTDTPFYRNAPSVNPRTMYRCRKRVRIITGIRISVPEANTGPHSMA